MTTNYIPRNLKQPKLQPPPPERVHVPATAPQRERPRIGEVGYPYSAGNRPPADRLPESVRDVLAEYDRVEAELHQLQRESVPLRDQGLDNRAKAEDDQESADLIRLGKPFRQVTDRRDQLARDRQSNADRTAAANKALRDIESQAIGQATFAYRATEEHAKALAASKEKAAKALARAADAAADWLAVEAVDIWLRGPGTPYAPADQVNVASVAPEILGRGIARDTAGQIVMSALFTRLQSIVTINQEEV